MTTSTQTVNRGNRNKASIKRSKRKSVLRFFVFLIILINLILISGFFVFTHNITTRTPPEIIPKADGIVVLTGRDSGRMDMGADLLRDGYGERLLISGVNTVNSHQDLIAVLNLPPNLAMCCVDHDYAKNTEQNGVETANWAKAHGFEHILLVTSSYHMPRAQAEISNAHGRIRITPYPVKNTQSKSWWKEDVLIKKYSKEYGKLLLSYMRAPSDRTTRKPIELPTATKAH